MTENKYFSFDDLSPEKLDNLPFIQNGVMIDFDLIRYKAIVFNRKDTLEWLHKQGIKFTDAAAQECLKYKRLELLKYIRSTGWEWSADIMNQAVHDVEILKWMIEGKCPHDPKRIIKTAIVFLYGNVEALKYLHEELHYPILEEHLKTAETLKRTACAEYIRSVVNKKITN